MSKCVKTFMAVYSLKRRLFIFNMCFELIMHFC